MSEQLILNTAVAFGDVDRDQLLLLPGVFKYLQEAAIKHADQFDAGTRAIASRGESWVLNRMVAAIHRYPKYEEPVRIVSWSSGIRSFKGYRDFRLYCGEELIVSASSLWLYISLRTKSIVRVPEALAAAFPSGSGEVFCKDIEKLRYTPPAPGIALTCPVSIRYSDIDGNGHVNNTAYLDFLQTALVRARLPSRPSRVEIQFLKEIPPDAGTVDVSLENRGATTAFSLGSAAGLFSQGQIS